MAKFLLQYDPADGRITGKMIVGSDKQAEGLTNVIAVTEEEFMGRPEATKKVNLETKKLEDK